MAKPIKPLQCLPGQSILTVPTFPNIGGGRFTPGGNNLAKKAYLYFLSQAGFRRDHQIELKDTGLCVRYHQVVIGNPISIEAAQALASA